MRGVLWFLVIAALVTIAGVLWLEHRHRQRAADEAQFEDELDQEFGDETTPTATVPPLPAEDLVWADDRDRAIAEVRVVFTGHEPETGDLDSSDDLVSQDVPDANSGRSGPAADPAAGLTPAQRRRAVKKGRIPRNVPAVVGRLGDTGHHSGAHNLPSPVRSPSASGPSPERASRAGEFHPHHERIPQPLEVWDPLMRDWMPVFPTLLESARHEAHFRQWEQEVGPEIDRAWLGWRDGFARLEQTDWIGAAA